MSRSLAEYLKSAREKAKFSQGEVAEQLNISRQAISRWENGKAYPDIDNLIRLSELYNMSLDELVKGKGFESKEEMHENKKFSDNTKKDSLEEIMIVGAALLTCTIPIIGLVLCILLVGYCVKTKKQLLPLFKIILAICLIINILNSWTYIRFNIFTDVGKATIEKVAFHMPI